MWGSLSGTRPRRAFNLKARSPRAASLRTDQMPYGVLGAGLALFMGLSACVSTPAVIHGDLTPAQEALLQTVLERQREADAMASRAPARIADDNQSPSNATKSDAIVAVAVSADGRYALASSSRRATVWEIDSRKQVGAFPVDAFSGTPSTFRIAGDCRVLERHAAPRQGSTVRDCRTGEEVARASLISDDTNTAASEPSVPHGKEQAAVGDPEHGILIGDLTAGRQSELGAPAGSWPLALSANGDILLAREYNVKYTGWRSVTSGTVEAFGALAQSLVPGVGTVDALAADVTSEVVGTTQTNEVVDIVAWNVRTRRKLFSVRTTLSGSSNVLSADGRTLFVENIDRSVDAYDVSGGHKHRVAEPEKHEAPGDLVPYKMVASMDGHVLARIRDDGSVEVFNTVSGKRLATLPIGESSASKDLDSGSALPATALPVLSSDGRLIAVWQTDHTVHVWEVASNQSVFQMPASAIAFSPDGRTALIGKADESAPVLRDLGTGNEAAFPAPCRRDCR